MDFILNIVQIWTIYRSNERQRPWLFSPPLARTRSIGALTLLPVVVREAKAAIEIAPAIDHCGPLRLLGTLLLRAPSWPTSVGDKDEALDTLKRAAEECPEHPGNHLYYGEALADNGEKEAAIGEFEKALALPVDPDWATMAKTIRDDTTRHLARLRK